MDSEDRDHFKTIAGASDGLRRESGSNSNKEHSPSRLDQAYCLSKAKAIAGCYRRDEAQDPDTFASALALVLSDFPKSIVEYVADPRTGIITSYPMGLPQVGQIKAFCEATAARQYRLEQYSEQPKFQRYVAPPIKREPGTSYVEMFEKYGRPIGRFEESGDQWNRGRKIMPSAGSTITKSELMEASRRMFEIECEQEGLDPKGLVSPALARSLAEPKNP